MKQMTVGKKIGLGFILTILLLIAVVAFSNLGVVGITEKADQMIENNQTIRWLTQMEIDHMDWVKRVSALITDPEVTELNVELDHKACEFGKWLYGQDRQEAEKMAPSLVPLLKAIEAPHETLHASAARIESIFVQADPNLPQLIVEREVELLKWAALLKDVLIKKEASLGLATEPDQTDIGRWIDSKEAKSAYDAGDDKFKAVFDQLVASHSSMLETALAIGDNLPAFAQLEKASVTRASVREEWTEISNKIFDTLNDIRTGIILPSRQQSMEQGNSDGISLWIQVEQSLNTDLAQVMLSAGQSVAQLSLEDSIMLPQILDMNRVNINNGIAAWKDITSGIAALEASTKKIEELTGKWIVGGLKNHQAVMDESSAQSMIEDAHYIYEEESYPQLEETLRLLRELKQMAKLSLQGRNAANDLFNRETAPSAESFRMHLEGIGNEMQKHSVTDREMLSTVSQVQRNVTLTGALAILIAIFAAVLIARSIIKVLRKISGRIDQGAGKFALATSQISTSSKILAEGTTTQAASLEETSASLEEMANVTQQNADHSANASRLMEETESITRIANDSMDELENSMAQISTASANTAEIIKTIDEIAFQTNLLALNAAVEAARAGEAGAGFAVVADEVRNLAIRAAEAARKTSDLIEDTSAKIKDGAALMNKTNDDFDKVEESVQKVSGLIKDITAASSEQADGINQVNQAVVEIDNITQQNAASAEESSASAEDMNAQIQFMKDLAGALMALVGGMNHRKDPDANEGKGSQKSVGDESNEMNLLPDIHTDNPDIAYEIGPQKVIRIEK